MADKDVTILGPETRVSGEISGDQDVVVQGRVEGRVSLTSSLTIEEGAIVQAEVQARVVLIAGAVVGNVSATEIIRLSEKARVVGDVTAPRVVIEAGAAYRGRLEMGEVELGSARATAARRPAEREVTSSASVKAPPRLATPARVAASSPAVQRVSSTGPVRVASVTPRPAPPSLPRPDAAAASGGVALAPGWAKKKLVRRR